MLPLLAAVVVAAAVVAVVEVVVFLFVISPSRRISARSPRFSPCSSWSTTHRHIHYGTFRSSR